MKKFLKTLGYLALMIITIIFGINGCMLLLFWGTPFHEDPSQWLLNTALGIILITIPLGLNILVFRKDLRSFGETKMKFLRNLFGYKQPAITSSNREQSVPAKIRLVMLPIQRKDIEHPSEESLRNLTEYITDLARLWISEKKLSRANLTISGYDDDPRELYEIPEVCQWANQTYNQFPSLLFFLTSASIDSFVGWLCGPVSKQTVASIEFAEKFMAKRQECLREAIAESSIFLQSIGADVSTISSFYFQSMEDFARERMKQ